MGMWGFGPTENDDAFSVLASVRSILDEAWQGLRDGARDRQTLTIASEAAAITSALGASAIDVMPEDAPELADDTDLPASIVRALTSRWPRMRPAFGKEGAVEKRLRLDGARYELWNWAAAFGDDHDAAWRACDDPDMLLRLASHAGIDAQTIRRAVASCIRPLVSKLDKQLRDVPDVVASVALGKKLDMKVVARLTKVLTTMNHAFTDAFTAALGSGGPRPVRDPRLDLLGLAVELTKSTPHWTRPIGWLAKDVPDLTEKLRASLQPSWSGALR